METIAGHVTCEIGPLYFTPLPKNLQVAAKCMVKIIEGAIKQLIEQLLYYTGLSQKGGGGTQAPSVFVRSTNPMSTRGPHFPHPVLRAPRIFRPCDGPEGMYEFGFNVPVALR